jgi:hypothetical protein
MHASGVVPEKERLFVFSRTVDEVQRASQQLFLGSFHAFPCNWSGVFTSLFAHATKTRVFCCVIFFGRFAIQQTARPKHRVEFRILRIIRILRLLFGIQVIKIAKEFIETVPRWKEFIAIT